MAVVGRGVRGKHRSEKGHNSAVRVLPRYAGSSWVFQLQ